MSVGKVKMSKTANSKSPVILKTENEESEMDNSVREVVSRRIEVSSNARETTIKTRFARLKTALRKRSVSIL